MPTPDDHAPPASGSRRPLGRGPGAAPPRAGSTDEAAARTPADPAQTPADIPGQAASEQAARLRDAPDPHPADEPAEERGPQPSQERSAPHGDASARGAAASCDVGDPGVVVGEEGGPPVSQGRSAPGAGGATSGSGAEPFAATEHPAAEGSRGPDRDGPAAADTDRPGTAQTTPARPAGPEATRAAEPEGGDGEVGAGGEHAGAAPSADAPPEAARAAAPEGGDAATGTVGEPAEAERTEDDGRFTVRLDNFEGPFDLLLQLISKHKLDVTEVALSKVTDEFMAHIRAMGPDWDLDQTTEFLVVAATLLDLKAARLLPAAEVEDEADLALLEARDLLFARLLQYRAYKRVADIFADRLAAEARCHPRTVGLEPHHAELLPEVALSIGPEGFARLAVKAMQPKPKPQVYVEHIHAPLVSVREQADVVVARLRELGEAGFRELIADAPDTLTVVARFLALLELYRERAVTLDQPEALGDLTVRWTGGEATGPLVTDEFDRGPQPVDQPEKEPQP